MKNFAGFHYSPLGRQSSEEDTAAKYGDALEKLDQAPEHSCRTPWSVWAIHIALGLLWTLAFAWLSWPRHARFDNPDRNSPLSSVLSYEPTKFHSGFGSDRTQYQGAPNDENNAAWDRLANVGIVALTPQEQARLPETSAIFSQSEAGTESTYLGAIEVFHQLHCLDMLRLEIYGNLTDWLQAHHSKKDRTEHVDHCIDYLRASLMCRPSIEVLPFRTDEATGDFRARFDGIHTCADFEAVRAWAVARQAGDLTPQ